MKNMKKFAAMMAALTLSACSIAPMAMTASAAEGEVNLTNKSDDVTDGVTHTYKLYQIFTGDFEEEGVLSDIKWGASVTDAGTYDDNVSDDDRRVPADVTKSLTENNLKTFIKALTLSESSFKTYSGTAPNFSDVPDGYYYIEDVTANLSAGDKLVEDSSATWDAKSAMIVKVIDGSAGDSITVKKSRPTINKEISDDTNADTGAGAETEWLEAADHAIGESFQFKLTATIPADVDFAEYEHYYLNFKDTMSEGVTFEKVDSITVDGGSDVKNSWTISTVDNNNSFTVSTFDVIPMLPDGVTLGSKSIDVVVTYSVHLNEKAKVHFKSTVDGGEGADKVNNNMVSLEYSSNPENAGDGTTKPDETSETPKDYVWAFTYGVENTKFDSKVASDKQLKDAKFKLYEGTVTAANVASATPISNLVLKNGAYYVNIEGTATDTLISADTTGAFNIIGLDAGTYTLVEIEAPNDFILPSNPYTTFTISATHSEVASGDKAVLNLSGPVREAVSEWSDRDISNMGNDFINTSKASLPSTGGMGTTLFYLGGGAMVAVAGVFLITKKRMGRSEN